MAKLCAARIQLREQVDDNSDWQAPTPMPTDGQNYSWNEGTLSWDAIQLD